MNKINDKLLSGQQLFIEEFMTKRNIMFVDIDGVLNNIRKVVMHGWSHEEFAKWRLENRDDFGAAWDEESCMWMNKVIDEYNMDIVISSSWRTTLEEMQELWCVRGMSGKVIGITPRIARTRGVEIREYLADNHKFRSWAWNWWESPHNYEYHYCDINNYVIVDDDSDMLYNQSHNFVNTHCELGFGEQDYKACKIILDKPMYKREQTNYKEILKFNS